MDDLFALLGEERRPWLDTDRLKERYHRLTAERHPDVAGGEGEPFAAINRAYQVLADPAARLRHLLELEGGSSLPARSQEVPEEIAGFFGPVGLARQRAAAFLKKHALASSPLSRALLSAEQYQEQENLGQIIEDLDGARERVLQQVAAADAVWERNRAGALARLPELWQSLSYLDKWLGVLREDLFQFASL